MFYESDQSLSSSQPDQDEDEEEEDSSSSFSSYSQHSTSSQQPAYQHNTSQPEPIITDIPEDALQCSYQDKSLSLEETREVILSGHQQHQEQTLSSLGGVKPGLCDDPAEVVVVITSLRGGVSSYFSSLRLMHLMNCKRVLWVALDTNKDVISGRALANSELLKAWQKDGVLAMTGDNKISVPQCLIDGVCVGNAIDVCALEEDGDLDYIINRVRCPKCLEDRDPDADECYSCGVQYRTLVPDELGAAEKVVYNIGFEEVPWDTNPLEHPLPGLPHIQFTPLEDVKSAVTF